MVEEIPAAVRAVEFSSSGPDDPLAVFVRKGEYRWRGDIVLTECYELDVPPFAEFGEGGWFNNDTQHWSEPSIITNTTRAHASNYSNLTVTHTSLSSFSLPRPVLSPVPSSDFGAQICSLPSSLTALSTSPLASASQGPIPLPEERKPKKSADAARQGRGGAAVGGVGGRAGLQRLLRLRAGVSLRPKGHAVAHEPTLSVS